MATEKVAYRRGLEPTALLIRVYVAVVAVTVVTLVVLSATGSQEATRDARVHALIVAAFAVLLPFRLRAAVQGSRSALRAVAIIAGVLLVVNLVEAALPALFPSWMRIEMVAIAALMAAVLTSLRRARG